MEMMPEPLLMVFTTGLIGSPVGGLAAGLSVRSLTGQVSMDPGQVMSRPGGISPIEWEKTTQWARQDSNLRPSGYEPGK